MTAFDITDTLAPKSDQLDAIDLRTSGPRVFTVERVNRGNSEQPVNVHLAEFDRPWRPGVNQRRVLGFCWGNDASQWVGRKVRLYCDEEVTFGKEKPGGTRISHLSDIDGKKSVPLLISQGRSGTYDVEPLTPDVETATLRSEWSSADGDRRKAIEARVAELKSSPAADAPGLVNREAAPDGATSESAGDVSSDYDPTLEPGFGRGAGS